jgi:hypothetical protein
MLPLLIQLGKLVPRLVDRSALERKRIIFNALVEDETEHESLEPTSPASRGSE